MESKPPQEPLEIKPTIEAEPILSFEEFSDRTNPNGTPNYNNFYFYFMGGPFPDIYRKKSFYKDFELENSILARSLLNHIQNEVQNKKGSRSELLKPFDKELYEAYKIMRKYTPSNQKLFS